MNIVCSGCNFSNPYTHFSRSVGYYNVRAFDARACLKNHSRNLHAPLCRIFHPNSVAVARYGALIQAKYPTNCDAHLAESIFQTHSSMNGHIAKPIHIEKLGAVIRSVLNKQEN